MQGDRVETQSSIKAGKQRESASLLYSPTLGEENLTRNVTIIITILEGGEGGRPVAGPRGPRTEGPNAGARACPKLK